MAVSFWQLPTAVDNLDNGAKGTVADDALCTRPNGIDHSRLLAIPTAEGTKAEGVAHPQHIVAIALFLLLGRRVELCFLKFQPLLELAIKIQCLTLVEIDADAIQLALEFHTVMVLQVVGVGTVAASRDALNEIIVAVLLLHLIVTHQHLSINSCGILSRTALVIKSHSVLFLLLGTQVGQEAELIESVILIEVVQLAWYLAAINGNNSRLHATVFL